MFWPLSAFFRQKVSLFYRFTFGRGYAFTFQSGEGALVGASALGQVRVWSYRFDSWDCSWFQVTVALRDARVTETGLGPDPRCNARDDAWN